MYPVHFYCCILLLFYGRSWRTAANSVGGFASIYATFIPTYPLSLTRDLDDVSPLPSLDQVQINIHNLSSAPP